MGDRTFANVSDDLHVGVGMGRKSAVRLDLVVVPYAQAAVPHVLGIIVAGEGEVVTAVIGAAEFVEGSEFDHDLSFPIIRVTSGLAAPIAALPTGLARGLEYAFRMSIK